MSLRCIIATIDITTIGIITTGIIIIGTTDRPYTGVDIIIAATAIRGVAGSDSMRWRPRRRPREVPVPVVHRLELAVDRRAGLRQRPHPAALRNEACTSLADGTAIVLAEVGNRLVLR
jgi:hypothetical protein